MSSNRGRGGALAALLAVALAAPGLVAAVVPSTGAIVSATNYPIDVGGMDAFDAHVSGDFASYTADEHIRYYDFFTGIDAQVPAPVGATDLLSDVSDGRIVFTRFFGGSARIMVFDANTLTSIEIDPQATPVLRFGAAIGNETVVFLDQTVNSNGAVYASFLGGATNLVASDSQLTQNPNVAPAGDVLVYERCASSPTDCAIRQAAWNGTSWSVSTITDDTGGAEANPDTDGVVVAYDAVRAGDRDIAWQPVGGGPEEVLALAGDQRNPSANGNTIAFESVGGDGTADLYVYDRANNRLFRVTSSPGIDDSLNDVFVLPNGTVRVVWAEGPSDDRDVRGADVALPPVGPTYSFGGFVQPVDPRPTLNSLKAGAAVPVKFSLGGDQGMNIFAAGYPKSQPIACDSTADVDGIETTVTAGGSSLSYDALSGIYTYVWKTDKSWAGTCRQLVLSFADGSIQRANFKLK